MSKQAKIKSVHLSDKKLREIYKEASKIWQKNKWHSLESIIRTLLMLQKMPTERLTLALQGKRALNAALKVDKKILKQVLAE